jgi:hypothetical protein
MVVCKRAGCGEQCPAARVERGYKGEVDRAKCKVCDQQFVRPSAAQRALLPTPKSKPRAKGDPRTEKDKEIAAKARKELADLRKENEELKKQKEVPAEGGEPMDDTSAAQYKDIQAHIKHIRAIPEETRKACPTLEADLQKFLEAKAALEKQRREARSPDAQLAQIRKYEAACSQKVGTVTAALKTLQDERDALDKKVSDKQKELEEANKQAATAKAEHAKLLSDIAKSKEGGTATAQPTEAPIFAANASQVLAQIFQQLPQEQLHAACAAVGVNTADVVQQAATILQTVAMHSQPAVGGASTGSAGPGQGALAPAAGPGQAALAPAAGPGQAAFALAAHDTRIPTEEDDEDDMDEDDGKADQELQQAVDLLLADGDGSELTTKTTEFKGKMVDILAKAKARGRGASKAKAAAAKVRRTEK